ncbi:hypothetical protein ANCCEY_12680 [Ancylostoma ceylanicum]|uniref:Uncharacterized protein n=2 Tax=Ancylostoma ceylanicum TaxID=53326 RepID=A0A0D6LE75_9BILA|nr:hypothetical protein ANCCEY_12680 [Ancylostoma ceylanicum]
MVAGGLLASLSFLVTGFVQLSVNVTLYERCYVILFKTTLDNRKTGESSMHLKAPKGAKTWTVPIQLSYTGCSNDKFQNLPSVFNAKLETTKIYYVAISANGVYQGKSDPSKPTQGTGEFSLGIVMAVTPRYDGNLVMCRMDAGDFDPAHPCNPRSPSDFYYWETNYDEGTDDREANYTLYTTQGASGAYAVDYVFKPVKPGRLA